MRDKMRHKCDNPSHGCFLLNKVGDLTVFDECFPNNIGIGDMDGIVEVNSHFLVLEFKGFNVPLPTGQRIMYERMTRVSGRFIILVVEIDITGMVVRSVQRFYHGSSDDIKPCTTDEFKEKLTEWYQYAVKKGK